MPSENFAFRLGRFCRNRKMELAVCLLALVCFFLPLRMGNDVNRDLPVFGWHEQVTQDYCERTLNKALAAYVATKSASRLLAVVSDAHMQASLPLVGGVSVAPGKMLSAAIDILERVSTGLFFVIGATLIGKLFGGMISVISFKMLLPLAGVCFCFSFFSGSVFPWARPVGKFLSQLAIVLWIFFPCTAMLNGYVEELYLDGVYQEKMKAIGEGMLGMEENDPMKKLDLAPPKDPPAREEAGPAGEKSAPVQAAEAGKQEEEGGFFSFLRRTYEQIKNIRKIPGEVADSVREKLNRVLTAAEDLTDNLTYALMILVLTTFVIPLVLLYIFASITGILFRDLRFEADLPSQGILRRLLGNAHEHDEKGKLPPARS